MMSNRVHRIVRQDANAVATACGRYGYAERRSSTEFDTDKGERFEAIGRDQGVDCRACLRAMGKIA